MHQLTLAGAEWRNQGLSPFTSTWFHHALGWAVLVVAVAAAVGAVRSVHAAAVRPPLRAVWTAIVVLLPVVGPCLWLVARDRLEARITPAPPAR